MAKKDKKKQTESFNINRKLKSVKTLISTGRIKEAIAYLYLIYTTIAGKKFDVTKTNSQTIRDFAIIMVKQYKQNPQFIYPFIQRIEQVVYGGYPATEEFFQDLLGHFSNLYKELTGTNMPSF